MAFPTPITTFPINSEKKKKFFLKFSSLFHFIVLGAIL